MQISSFNFFFLFILFINPDVSVSTKLSPLRNVTPTSQGGSLLRYEPFGRIYNKTNFAISSESIKMQQQRQEQQNVIQPLLFFPPKNLQFGFKDCGNQSSILKFLDLNISPNPVVTPGPIRIKFRIQVKQTIFENLQADLKVSRKIGPIYIPIPCIAHVGSCIYEDICNQMKLIKQCPPPFILFGFNCRCPFYKGLINIPSVGFDIQTALVPSGDYALHVVFNHKNKFAGCLKLEISFKRDQEEGEREGKEEEGKEEKKEKREEEEGKEEEKEK